MSFDPQKFFIGIIDLFSILLPGAALVYLTKDLVVLPAGIEPWTQLDGTGAWLAFLFASYLTGHLVFLLSAKLDDYLYDPLRKGTYLGQIDRLKNGDLLSGALTRRIAEWIFGRNADAAVVRAVQLKTQMLAPHSAASAINAFQWCKARLSKEHPQGLSAVQRFEADSKFFRSFAVVLAALVPVYAYHGYSGAAAICIGLLLPVTWRYLDQRFKATQQAYWFVITLECMKERAAHVQRTQKSGTLTHAGGVVFRRTRKTVEYLIIQDSKGRGEWVLPKGHIEPDEDPRATAVREIHEEADCWARIANWLDDVPLPPSAPMVRFYLTELVAYDATADNRKKVKPSDRDQLWLPRDEAIAKASFPEAKALIEKADKLVNPGPHDQQLP